MIDRKESFLTLAAMAKPGNGKKIDDKSLCLQWKEGKSAVEIAKSFGVPPMAIYNRMRRLRGSGVALPRRASKVDVVGLNKILGLPSSKA